MSAHRDVGQWMRDKIAGRKKPKVFKTLAALTVPVPVDTSNYGLWDAGGGFYGVGGELNLPVPSPDQTPVKTILTIPACKVVSWQGNVSVWTTGDAEVLFVLYLDGAVFLPLIAKCAGTGKQGKEVPVDFRGLDWPCPAGTLTLSVGWLCDQPMNWEMQTILKTVPVS